jgi:dTDP-4-amino-4,6-dideoxygalactose transaminase
MKKVALNDLPIMDTKDGIVLFHPHMPKNAFNYVKQTLESRWIGHGPKVDLFEQKFQDFFEIEGYPIAVGSGTDALHLSYLLANIKNGDEVLVPLFTCTATNIPLLYLGAKLVFVDIDPGTLNVSVEDLRKKISKKTKMIVVVHYGGLPCDMDEINALAREYNIPVVEDAAHALGGKYSENYIGNISDFTMFSFQAIKHLTTGDGGMLITKDRNLAEKAKRLRWFGINRENKQKGIWENDLVEIGFKYQMTDIAASIGLAGLEEFEETIALRKKLFNEYISQLKDVDAVQIVNDNDSKKEHAAWLFTILVSNRDRLRDKLRKFGIESGQTHYRNDRYSIFNENGNFPNMDSIDDKYLILPLHTKMTLQDVEFICNVIKGGW